MSCTYFQQLLHLNRTGELSGKEAEELREHLRLCESCSLEFQRIQRADHFINRLTLFSPVPRNEEQLTAAIMQRVRRSAAPSVPAGLADRILDLFIKPPVRFAAAAVIVLILFTFGIQLYTTLNSIADLEFQMASVRGRASSAGEPTITAQSSTLQEVTRSKSGRSVADELSLTASDGRIEVPEKNVQSVLSMYNMGVVSATVDSSVLHLDRKTLEKIIIEIRSTAARTIRAGGHGD